MEPIAAPVRAIDPDSERTGSGEKVPGTYTSDPDAETLTCAAPGVEPMDGLDFTD